MTAGTGPITSESVEDWLNQHDDVHNYTIVIIAQYYEMEGWTHKAERVVKYVSNILYDVFPQYFNRSREFTFPPSVPFATRVVEAVMRELVLSGFSKIAGEKSR